DLSNMDETLSTLNPRFLVPVAKELCPDGGLLIEPKSLKDLRPEGLIKAVPFLRALSEASRHVAQAVVTGQSPAGLAADLRSKWPELPQDLMTLPDGAFPPKASNHALDDILSMVAAPTTAAGQAPAGSGDWTGRFDARIAAVL
ncbi:MAG: type VI secretion system contractile sheath small subunit, partial [Deltaproteobacteria bacterium]|nr:type VI secretion system contractile sheath small subunit [Deltaproteobacteria bacterium]